MMNEKCYIDVFNKSSVPLKTEVMVFVTIVALVVLVQFLLSVSGE